MRHPSAIEWDRRLKVMFDEIDDILEERYGDKWRLHPNRPERGDTSNKEMDGLFNVGADFSPGYGSRLGRGYVVQIRLSTLDWVPRPEREAIESDVENIIRSKLPEKFPERKLKLERDGKVLKIYGDLSLGSVLKK